MTVKVTGPCIDPYTSYPLDCWAQYISGDPNCVAQHSAHRTSPKVGFLKHSTKPIRLANLDR